MSQVMSTTSSDGTMTPRVAKTQDAVNEVLLDSGIAFREGLVAYVDDNRNLAGEKFNKSVEVFLYSSLNIQKDERLHGCYNELIETVYRIEFPAENQLPQIRNLASTCTWNIDTALSDTVVRLARPLPIRTAEISTMTTKVSGQNVDSSKVGFSDQEFEPSPLDDLSKLELTEDEQLVETNPIAQQQYQYLQYTVANKSLGFSFVVNPTIQQYVNYYRGRGKPAMEVGLYRSGMFMRMAHRIYLEEGVPENIVWIGQLASGWVSSRGGGIWNLNSIEAKRFGLQQNKYVNEAKSFDEATRASARYLKQLFKDYKSWEFAIAAYAFGEERINSLIKQSKAGDYWSVQRFLPSADQNFVPSVLATIMIANSPNEYGFGHVRPAPTLIYDRIRVPESTDLSLIAHASDTSVQYLHYLNPHLLSNVTPPEPYVINIPAGKANDVAAMIRLSNAKLQEIFTSGETWQMISNRTGVSVADLMAANRGMTIPQGKVFVPIKGNNVPSITYSRPTTPNPPTVRSVKVVTAKAGDTVESVAKRYGADPIEVAKYNGLLPHSMLSAGREIKIPSK